jgi:hypothetical protein
MKTVTRWWSTPQALTIGPMSTISVRPTRPSSTLERFKLVDGGEALDVRVHVEDPGAFTMPWNAGQRHRRDQRKEEVPLHEMVCAENNEDHFNQGLVPIPQADKVEF